MFFAQLLGFRPWFFFRSISRVTVTDGIYTRRRLRPYYSVSFGLVIIYKFDLALSAKSQNGTYTNLANVTKSDIWSIFPSTLMTIFLSFRFSCGQCLSSTFFHVGSGGLIFSQTSPAISHGTSLLLVQFFFGSTDVPRTQRIQEIAQVVRNGSHRLDLTVLTVLGMERYGTVWGGMGRYGEVWVVYRERVWVG